MRRKIYYKLIKTLVIYNTLRKMKLSPTPPSTRQHPHTSTPAPTPAGSPPCQSPLRSLPGLEHHPLLLSSSTAGSGPCLHPSVGAPYHTCPCLPLSLPSRHTHVEYQAIMSSSTRRTDIWINSPSVRLSARLREAQFPSHANGACLPAESGPFRT